MNVWTRRALWVVVLLVLCGVGALAAVYRMSWQRYEHALEVLEPRLERLAGIVEAEPRISTQLDAANQTLEPLLHPGGDAAQNDVQQKLRQLIAASGSTLITSQAVLDAGSTQHLAQVRITATVTGEWPKLVLLLDALQNQRPPLWIRTSMLMRENGSQTAEPQMARLVLQVEAPVLKGGKP